VLHDLTGGRPPRELTAVKGGGWSLALSADGGLLAVGPLAGARDRAVRLVDTAKDTVTATVGGGMERAGAVAFSPDGKTLAIGTLAGTVHLLEVATGRPVGPGVFAPTSRPDPAGARFTQLAFAPDGRTLASVDRDGNLRLWDVTTGAERCWLGAGLEAVAFAPDGRLLAAGHRDRSVRLWDPATGDERARLVGHLGPVRAVAFAGDGGRLYTGGDDGMAVGWDVAAVLTLGR
jgi:WD40 repeat protein